MRRKSEERMKKEEGEGRREKRMRRADVGKRVWQRKSDRDAGEERRAPSFRRMADVHFGMILLTFGVGSINWLSFSRFT